MIPLFLLFLHNKKNANKVSKKGREWFLFLRLDKAYFIFLATVQTNLVLVYYSGLLRIITVLSWIMVHAVYNTPRVVVFMSSLSEKNQPLTNLTNY